MTNDLNSSDIRKMLEEGGCPPSHGCGAATACLCSLVEDATDYAETLEAENARLRSAGNALALRLKMVVGREDIIVRWEQALEPATAECKS